MVLLLVVLAGLFLCGTGALRVALGGLGSQEGKAATVGAVRGFRKLGKGTNRTNSWAKGLSQADQELLSRTSSEYWPSAPRGAGEPEDAAQVQAWLQQWQFDTKRTSQCRRNLVVSEATWAWSHGLGATLRILVKQLLVAVSKGHVLAIGRPAAFQYPNPAWCPGQGLDCYLRPLSACDGLSRTKGQDGVIWTIPGWDAMKCEPAATFTAADYRSLGRRAGVGEHAGVWWEAQFTAFVWRLSRAQERLVADLQALGVGPATLSLHIRHGDRGLPAGHTTAEVLRAACALPGSFDQVLLSSDDPAAQADVARGLENCSAAARPGRAPAVVQLPRSCFEVPLGLTSTKHGKVGAATTSKVVGSHHAAAKATGGPRCVEHSSALQCTLPDEGAALVAQIELARRAGAHIGTFFSNIDRFQYMLAYADGHEERVMDSGGLEYHDCALYVISAVHAGR